MLIYAFALKRLSAPLYIYSELEKMLAMRALGMSYTDLATEFHVKRDTIIYLCQKFKLGGAMSPPIPKRHPTSISAPTPHTEEAINPGKTYAEYLQIERDRKWNRLTSSHLKVTWPSPPTTPSATRTESLSHRGNQA